MQYSWNYTIDVYQPKRKETFLAFFYDSSRLEWECHIREDDNLDSAVEWAEEKMHRDEEYIKVYVVPKTYAKYGQRDLSVRWS